MKKFSSQIKHFRQKRKWSQQKLAEKTGLSWTIIAKIEQSRGENPTLKTMLKLAEAFGVGLDELVGRR